MDTVLGSGPGTDSLADFSKSFFLLGWFHCPGLCPSPSLCCPTWVLPPSSARRGREAEDRKVNTGAYSWQQKWPGDECGAKATGSRPQTWPRCGKRGPPTAEVLHSKFLRSSRKREGSLGVCFWRLERERQEGSKLRSLAELAGPEVLGGQASEITITPNQGPSEGVTG